MADTATISRYRGDTYPIRVYIKDSDGTALDITSCSFKLTVNSSSAPTSTTGQLFQLTGSIVNPASAGIVDFAITSQQANNLGQYWYDVEMTDASSYKRTVLTGIFEFTQDITKDS